MIHPKYMYALLTGNRLLQAVKRARDPKSTPSEISTIMQMVQSDHLEALHGYIRNRDIARRLAQDIKGECRKAVALLQAAQTMKEMTPGCLDWILSTGEKLSAMFLCALLRDQGLPAEYVNLSEVVDVPEALPLDSNFFAALAVHLGAAVQACQANIVVVTGHFGRVPGGLMDAAGRGYTDLCAALLAAGIPGSQLQIWKELDGIFTADPRCVRTARLLSTISPAEASELTFYGSEVIHPLAMKQAVRGRVPISIKGVLNPHGHGSVLLSEIGIGDSGPGHGHVCRASARLIRRRRRAAAVLDLESAAEEDSDEVSEGGGGGGDGGRPVALTMKRKMVVLKIESTEGHLSHRVFASVFATLDKWRLAVDLVTTSEASISLAVHSDMEASDAPALGDGLDPTVNKQLRGAIQDLIQGGSHVECIPGMAIVGVIGRHMRRSISTPGEIFLTLGKNNIDIEMISLGEFIKITDMGWP
jgi:aspartate kinase